MRTWHTTSLRTLALTAVFGMAQVGAALLLAQRFEPYRTVGGPGRALLVGLALLLAVAEMLVAVGGARAD